MKFNKKDWKVTDLGGAVSVECLNPVIDEDGTDLTDWPTSRWFKKNFKIAKDIDTSETGYAGDSEENPEWIWAKK
jgi:hypothetical protein